MQKAQEIIILSCPWIYLYLFIIVDNNYINNQDNFKDEYPNSKIMNRPYVISPI